ncbi:hypothetical protein D920_02122 [Enterococcus faecalis 13-SD-W-01]|jgi:hypothetical protein|nr:hypothetical protein D920_02122 [Enterococcus faecalis 13-SD-W-01]
MKKRLLSSFFVTILYLFVSNMGNLFFGVTRTFSWTTTLWESAFFFLFVFLLQNFRKK